MIHTDQSQVSQVSRLSSAHQNVPTRRSAPRAHFRPDQDECGRNKETDNKEEWPVGGAYLRANKGFVV